MKTALQGLLVAASLALCAGCGDIQVATTDCEHGERFVCDCPDGTLGVQLCGSNGQLQVCTCGDVGGDVGGAGGDADAGAPDVGVADSGAPDTASHDAAGLDVGAADVAGQDLVSADPGLADPGVPDGAAGDAAGVDAPAQDLPSVDPGLADLAPADPGPADPGPPEAATCSEGQACDDGDPCTANDTCDAAGGCAGAPLVCPVASACSTYACVAGSCVKTFATPGTLCDDGDACTQGESCNVTGGCLGAPVLCQDDGDPCTTVGCDPADGACVATPLPNPGSAVTGQGCLFIDQVLASLSPPFTLELWIRPTGGNHNSERLVDAYDAGGFVMGFATLGGGLYFTDALNPFTSPVSVAGGTWQHVVASWTAGNQMRLYVDGKLEDTRNGGGWGGAPDYLWVGCREGAPIGGNLGDFFNGRIDEVRISSIERYPGQSYPVPGLLTADADTVALYHLDADPGPGGVFPDASGHGFDAVWWDGLPAGTVSTNVPFCPGG